MNNNQEQRLMPASKEAEMMVLGCMLTNINSLNIAAEALDESAFYYSEHKTIFRVLKKAYESDKPADVHLICEELKQQEKLNDVGGPTYIIALAQFSGTSAYIDEYLEIVKEHQMRRSLIQLCQRGVEELLDNEDPSKTLLSIQENCKLIETIGCSKDKFQIRFLNEFGINFLLSNPPHKPMLLEYANESGSPVGFLPKGIVAMIVGAGGVGKTHLLAQLAIAVASGTPWLGMCTTTSQCGSDKKGNVFFGLGENQYDDIHRVLYKASKYMRSANLDLLVDDRLVDASKRIAAFSFCGQQSAFIDGKKPSKYFHEFKMQLIEFAPLGGWDLIILDPVSRLMGADAETDNAAATQFISLLEQLTIDLPGNPTILFAHHVSKAAIKENSTKKPSEGASQADSRGASALTDGVRWQANFYKNGSDIFIEMTKSNFTKIIDPIHLERDYDGYLRKKDSSQNLVPISQKKPIGHKY